MCVCVYICVYIYMYVYIFKDFRERRGGEKKERERNVDVREKHQLVASSTHPD